MERCKYFAVVVNLRFIHVSCFFGFWQDVLEENN